jgi:hypothetical protein
MYKALQIYTKKLLFVDGPHIFFKNHQKQGVSYLEIFNSKKSDRNEEMRAKNRINR